MSFPVEKIIRLLEQKFSTQGILVVFNGGIGQNNPV